MARGRPRSFDREAALAEAMKLFWAKGYEAAQLTELMSAMSLNPPSFYAAFGSKEQIFREALDLYLATAGAGAMRALRDTPDTRDAIAAMLRASVEVALSNPGAGGCLVSLALVNCQDRNESLRDDLRALRRTTAALIRERLRRGIQEGDLPPEADAEALADYFAMIVQGLSTQAQDAATREQLLRNVEISLSVLD